MQAAEMMLTMFAAHDMQTEYPAATGRMLCVQALHGSGKNHRHHSYDFLIVILTNVMLMLVLMVMSL